MTNDELDAAQAADEARLAAPGAVLAAARWYIARGLPIFPVNGKLPQISRAHKDGNGDCRGECGREGHGLYDATLDPELLERWWRRWPEAGVAAPTGLLYDVVDIDGPPGYLTMAKLAEAAGVTEIAQLFPEILGKVKTVRGAHFLIPLTGRGNGAAVLGAGVDIRGAGGYTVLPPSKRDGVVAYRWITPPTFGKAQL